MVCVLNFDCLTHIASYLSAVDLESFATALNSSKADASFWHRNLTTVCFPSCNHSQNHISAKEYIYWKYDKIKTINIKNWPMAVNNGLDNILSIPNNFVKNLMVIGADYFGWIDDNEYTCDALTPVFSHFTNITYLYLHISPNCGTRGRFYDDFNNITRRILTTVTGLVSAVIVGQDIRQDTFLKFCQNNQQLEKLELYSIHNNGMKKFSSMKFEFDLDVIDNLSNLKDLTLFGIWSDIMSVSYLNIAKLPKLVKFSMKGELHKDTDAFIEKLAYEFGEKLTHLRFSGEFQLYFNAFSSLTNLVHLDLGGIPYTSYTYDYFKLKNLVKLQKVILPHKFKYPDDIQDLASVGKHMVKNYGRKLQIGLPRYGFMYGLLEDIKEMCSEYGECIELRI